MRSDGTSGVGYSYDALGNLIDQRAFGVSMTDLAYRYTGQEFDNETGLHNFRARLYDSDLFRFYATDPAGQGFSPFAYAGNSPLMFVDPSGEVFWIPLVLGAVINVASNWNAITAGGGFDIGRLAGFALVGAGSGYLNTLGPLGWIASGALSGAANTGLSGGDASSILQNAGIGAISSLAGGLTAGSLSQFGLNINGANIKSPIVDGLLKGAIGGALGGSGAGATAALLTGGNVLEGALKGASSGALYGGFSGAVTTGVSAYLTGVNPVSGDYMGPRVTGAIGEEISGLALNKESRRLGGSRTFPDDINETTMSEVKNVKEISPNSRNERQIDLQIRIAQREGLEHNLIVRELRSFMGITWFSGTEITSTLIQGHITNGNTNLNYLPRQLPMRFKPLPPWRR